METQSKRGHPHRPLVSLRVMELKASADKAAQTPAEFIPGGTAKPRAMICTRDISTTWSFSPSNFALLCTSPYKDQGYAHSPRLPFILCTPSHLQQPCQRRTQIPCSHCSVTMSRFFPPSTMGGISTLLTKTISIAAITTQCPPSPAPGSGALECQQERDNLN